MCTLPVDCTWAIVTDASIALFMEAEYVALFMSAEYVAELNWARILFLDQS